MAEARQDPARPARYAIALTSIPPRFGQLPRVLAALLAQSAPPEAVFLTLPRRFRRFAPMALPALPFGVTLLRPKSDPGPIGKLLPAARAYGGDLLICDDDWLYGHDWAAAFLAVRREASGAVLAGSTWDGARIGHPGCRVMQGFAGALIPAGLARKIPTPPEVAWPVDDIWISGHLPPAVEVAAARRHMVPLASPGALQEDPRRDAANRATAALAPWPGHGPRGAPGD